MGMVHESVSPEGLPVDLASLEPPGIEPVGQVNAALRGDAQQSTRTSDQAGRGYDEELAGCRPRAHPVGPGGGMRPAGGRALVYRLQHQQFGAVQVANDWHMGSNARRSRIQGGQVVEMEDIRLRRTSLV